MGSSVKVMRKSGGNNNLVYWACTRLQPYTEHFDRELSPLLHGSIFSPKGMTRGQMIATHCESLGSRWLRGRESTCQSRRHGLAPWSGKIPQATEQLSPCTTTTEPVLWSLEAIITEPTRPNYWSLSAPEPVLPQEKPLQGEAHALQPESSPCTPQPHSNEDPNEDSQN